VHPLAAGVVNNLDDVWRQLSLSLHTKLSLYSACVMTVLLYGCETWTFNKRMWAKLPYVTSAQNLLNQVEQLHPECYSGRHI